MADDKVAIQDRTFVLGIDAEKSEDQLPVGSCEDILNGYIEAGRINKRKGQEYKGALPINVVGVDAQTGNNALYFLLSANVDSGTLSDYLSDAGDIQICGSLFYSNISAAYNMPLFGFKRYKIYSVDKTNEYVNIVYDIDHELVTGDRVVFTHAIGDTEVVACTDVLDATMSYYVRLITTTAAAAGDPAIASYTLHTTRQDAFDGTNNIVWEADPNDTVSPLPTYMVQPRIIARDNLTIPSGSYTLGTFPDGLVYIKAENITDVTVAVDEETIPCVLSLYGGNVGAAYSESIEPEHIDSYKVPAGSNLLCGAEGIEYREVTDPGLVTSYPRIRANIDDIRVIGPAIYDTGETPGRTSYYMTCDNGGSHFVQVTQFEYVSGTTCRVHCYAANKKVFTQLNTEVPGGALSTVMKPGYDQVTLTNMRRSELNGVFEIVDVATTGPDTFYFAVTMDDIVDNRYDETGLLGEAAVYSDKISVTENNLIVGDKLNHYSLRDVNGELLYDTYVIKSDSVSVVVSPLQDPVTLVTSYTQDLTTVDSSFIPCIRTSTAIPMRGPYGYEASATFHQDDFNVTANYISITPSSSDADYGFTIYDTVVITGEGPLPPPLKTHQRYVIIDFYQGDQNKIILGYSAEDVDEIEFGSYTPPESPVATTFTIRAITCDIVAGDCVQFSDEGYTHRVVSTSTSITLPGLRTVTFPYEVTATDCEDFSCYVKIVNRYEPLTSPVDDYLSTNPMHPVNLVDNTNQSRSAMVSGCMYFTNYIDPVRKFDGENHYRAGIIPFRPTIGMTLDTSASDKVDILPPSLASVSATAGSTLLKFAATPENVRIFVPGDIVRLGTDTVDYTVVAVNVDTTTVAGPTTLTTGTITLDKAASSTASVTVTKQIYYRYYFRFNYVDAQNNIVASACTDPFGAEMRLTASAAINIHLCNLPTFDYFKYYAIDVEIYRTKIDSLNVFYKVASVPLTFDAGQNYVHYVDSKNDSDLTQVDNVMSALLGNNLGTAWSDAPRAKYISSVDNRLVLGNIKTNPEIDVSFNFPASVAVSGGAGVDDLVFVLAQQEPEVVNSAPIDFYSPEDYVHKFIFTADTFTAITVDTESGDTVTMDRGSAHGLSVGDWVYIKNTAAASANPDLTYTGWWQVFAVPTANKFSFHCSYRDAGTPTYTYIADTFGRVPISLITDENQLNTVSSEINNRLADNLARAINAVMASVDPYIDFGTNDLYQYDWSPWLIAKAGGLFKKGQIVIESPVGKDIVAWFEPKSIATAGRSYVSINGSRVTTGEIVQSVTPLYPSRIAVSYSNFPEMFDNLRASNPEESDSIIDVNSSDGEEITGMIPFFGEAAFDQSKQSANIVVFKENSIYIVDVRQKELYRVTGGARGLANPVQRLETNGIGCTAPYSIAASKHAIFFANESGIWALGRDLSVNFVGEPLDRLWARTNKDYLSLYHGHHDPKNRTYMLSYTNGSDETFDDAFVFKHSVDQPAGSWTRYDNIPALGWANLNYESRYLSTSGEVWGWRDLGLTSDFRDDADGISTEVTFRTISYGEEGIRMNAKYVLGYYKPYTQIDNIDLYYATDFNTTWTQAGSFSIDVDTTTDNLSDLGSKKMEMIKHGLADTRCHHLQLKLVWDGADEAMDFAGWVYRVTPLDDKGITEAGETSGAN
jgi:hypothetical protein